MDKLVIVLHGGLVTEVYSTLDNLEIDILDEDNLEEDGEYVEYSEKVWRKIKNLKRNF